MTESKELVGQFIDLAASNPKEARQLFRKHPGLRNARWIHNESLLHFLCVEGSAEGVRLLIELGFDLNATNEFGDPPLIDVVTLGRYEMAEMLLQAGARTDVESRTKGFPLELARENGDARMEKLLIQYGAKQ